MTMITREDCEALDRQDPLAGMRAAFEPTEPGWIYLDANSLGAMPKAAPERVLHAMRACWNAQRAYAWGAANWSDISRRIGASLSRLVGADPEELVAVDSTTVNLYKLLTYGLRLAQPDRTRTSIVYEANGFPTDAHVVQGVARQSNGRWRLRPIDAPEALDAALSDDVAMVVLSHADYRTSFRFDMRAVNAKAHAAGARTLWDLSHTAGAVPVDLHASNADFAVACTYKYLCGGPGSAAVAFIRRDLQDRDWPTMTGWQGRVNPMEFNGEYLPAPGMRSLLSGTTPVLQNVVTEAAAEIWARVDRDHVAAKHRSLSHTLIALLDEQCGPLGVKRISPADYDRQGGHVAYGCPDANVVCEALFANRVVTSFRKPDVLRFGLSVATVSHVDLWNAAARLKTILSEARALAPRSSTAAA